MAVEKSAILKGKVTGITKFGAFVALETGDSGMVHISEISNSYISEIRDHLSDGQEVTVKVIGIDEKGRINLSIKQAMPDPTPQRPRPQKNFSQASRPPQQNRGKLSFKASASTPSEEKPHDAFEDMLSRFKQESDSRLADIKASAEGKRSGGRGRSRR